MRKLMERDHRRLMGECGRRLIDRRGVAEIELATGPRTSAVRCAPHANALLMMVPKFEPVGLQVEVAVELDDQPARILLHDCDSRREQWAALELLGWLGVVPDAAVGDALESFLDRHITVDVLMLGRAWTLLMFEPVQGEYRDPAGSAMLDEVAVREMLSTVRQRSGSVARPR